MAEYRVYVGDYVNVSMGRLCRWSVDGIKICYIFVVNWASGKSHDLPLRHRLRFSKEILNTRTEVLVAFCSLSREIRGFNSLQ